MSIPFLESVEVPKDDPPVFDPPSGGDYDPEFPGSTPDAPYGFKPDGTPYKRRPNGAGSGSGKKAGGGKKTGSSDRSAQTAASLLARMNGLVGISLTVFGMPATAMSLAEANDQFETMAYEALRSDPELCRKILAAGATSGKAGLVMAYGMLGVSIAPAALTEIREKRATRDAERDEDVTS